MSAMQIWFDKEDFIGNEDDFFDKNIFFEFVKELIKKFFDNKQYYCGGKIPKHFLECKKIYKR